MSALVAILLVFTAALPAIGSSALILFGTRSERSMLGWFGVLPGEDIKTWVSLLGGLLRYVIALGATVLVTALMYCVAPNRPLKFRSVLPGAFRGDAAVAAGDLRASPGMCGTSPTTTCSMAASAL